MLNENFCEFLEYHLCKTFSNSNDNALKYFWCDGILLPASEKEISKKYVNDKREIIMTAFIGLDGQTRYELILNFGKKSLSRYSRGLDIKECVPSFENDNWLNIDIENHKIKLQLD